MVDAVGPVYTGRFEEFVVRDDSGGQHTLLFLADRNNNALQREGKPPAYYWVPGEVRLARFGDTGDYKFRHLHFVGILDEDQHIGVEGNSEVSGGLMSFTTTSRFPTAVLQQATDQLLERFRGTDDRYWGWRTSASPRFAMVPITSNQTAVTNLSPGRNGVAPAENLGGADPGGNGSGPPGASRSLIRRAPTDLVVEHGRAPRSNIDAWAFDLQGEGPGSVTGGENAYSGLMGALPSELIWAGFRGGSSPISVAQNLIMPVWSQELYLKITGEWDRIFQHFSAHANAGYKWFGADIKAEFNRLRLSGGIEVELAIDGTLPQGADIERAIDERIDLITSKFMEEATRVIFEPAAPEVEPAEAPSGGLLSRVFGGNAGFALNYRRDQTSLRLHYEETRHHRYNQPTTISGSLEGFAREIEGDERAADRYFQRVVLGQINRRVSRIVKPVANWPSPEKNWVGEPVAFMSAQLGYPDDKGAIQWSAHVFQSTDTTSESTWRPAFVQRSSSEVSDPPEGWEPDVAFIKRKVHLQEAPGAFDNPHVRMLIEKNEIDLDPGERGTPGRENVLEVRADRVGILEVGPIQIGAVLQDTSQIVEVTFRPEGRTLDGQERPDVRFSWRHDDQDDPRFLKIFTGDLDYRPRYQYKVRVIVRGTIFSSGMEWEGPWVDGQGNGPLMVTVPPADAPDVRRVHRQPRELAAGPVAPALDAGRPAESPATRPPGVVETRRSEPDHDDVRLVDDDSPARVGGYDLDPGTARSRSAPRGTREGEHRGEESDESQAGRLELVLDGWRPG